MLTPFAVARIHKSLLYCLQKNILKLSDEEWDIAIIERDVPCASIAIEDFRQLLGNLLVLEGKEDTRNKTSNTAPV